VLIVVMMNADSFVWAVARGEFGNDMDVDLDEW
jgi:hypothetical protein